MKKILVLLLAILLVAGCNSKKDEDIVSDPPKKAAESVMAYGDYKNITIDNINSVTKIRYTEAGDATEEITDLEEIKALYNGLSELKIGEETKMACEDNTTVYRFNLNNGKNYSIEIECEWFVISGKRYNIVK